MFTKESLELLRQRIDLPELLSVYLHLQRAGSSYKALCPFHEEKSPSLIVQKGSAYYHCFGCGAHGDAIAFLMSHVKMSFTEAVESLSERFHVAMDTSQGTLRDKGPSKVTLKAALELTSKLYHYLLLHSQEGQEALKYLYARGLNVAFIRQFEIGYAPRQSDLLISYLRAEGVSEEVQEGAGLVTVAQSGRRRDFFSERITFPIRDALGSVIGFSARKFQEETFGGKYINTPETALFKKSRVLFGLSYCRAYIAKEAKAMIVEGQIDCLRLIHAGFNYTIAGQGTAFSEDHVKELLHLGVKKVYLALDGDAAGQEAAVKIGNLLQSKGVEVFVVALPQGHDPDSLLKEKGPEPFAQLLVQSRDYLNFLFFHLSQGVNLSSPSGKNEVVSSIVDRIKRWEMPVMVHESLRKLAEISHVPEAAIGMGQIVMPDLWMKKKDMPNQAIDPNRIVEGDLLRWLILASPQNPFLKELAAANLAKEHLRTPGAVRLYEAFLQNSSNDLFSLGACLQEEEDHQFLREVMQRKVNLQKAEEGIKETIRSILVRRWMEEREAIRTQLQSGNLTEEEAMSLAKQFDEIKRRSPKLREEFASTYV